MPYLMKTLAVVPIAAILFILTSCSKQNMPVPDESEVTTIKHYSNSREITDTLADRKALPPKKVPVPKKG
jgi:hypothetical protein